MSFNKTGICRKHGFAGRTLIAKFQQIGIGESYFVFTLKTGAQFRGVLITNELRASKLASTVMMMPCERMKQGKKNKIKTSKRGKE